MHNRVTQNSDYSSALHRAWLCRPASGHGTSVCCQTRPGPAVVVAAAAAVTAAPESGLPNTLHVLCVVRRPSLTAPPPTQTGYLQILRFYLSTPNPKIDPTHRQRQTLLLPLRSHWFCCPASSGLVPTSSSAALSDLCPTPGFTTLEDFHHSSRHSFFRARIYSATPSEEANFRPPSLHPFSPHEEALKHA